MLYKLVKYMYSVKGFFYVYYNLQHLNAIYQGD
jgi:hypothetical protein